MQTYKINIIVSVLLMVTGLIIAFFSSNYNILATIFMGLAIVELINAWSNYRKSVK